MFAPDPHGARWRLALKATDMERAGHTHPQIALEIFNGGTVREFARDWRRSRVRRLLDNAHALIDGDYLKILARSAKVARRAA